MVVYGAARTLLAARHFGLGSMIPFGIWNLMPPQKNRFVLNRLFEQARKSNSKLG